MTDTSRRRAEGRVIMCTGMPAPGQGSGGQGAATAVPRMLSTTAPSSWKAGIIRPLHCQRQSFQLGRRASRTGLSAFLELTLARSPCHSAVGHPPALGTARTKLCLYALWSGWEAAVAMSCDGSTVAARVSRLVRLTSPPTSQGWQGPTDGTLRAWTRRGGE